MRTTPDHTTDPLGNLGKAIREDKPAPAPTPVSPGIVRNPNGQLETQIAPPAPVWHSLPVIAPVVIEQGSADEWAGLDWQSVTNF